MTNDSNSSKISQIYYCEMCDITPCCKKDYKNHILTLKHKKITENTLNNSNIYDCLCGKIYKYRQGLHKHKKNCVKVTGENKKDNDNILVELFKLQMNENKNLKELFLDKTTEKDSIIIELMKHCNEQKNTPANNDELVAELIKQNNEFKELMLEQSKYSQQSREYKLQQQ